MTTHASNWAECKHMTDVVQITITAILTPEENFWPLSRVQPMEAAGSTDHRLPTTTDL